VGWWRRMATVSECARPRTQRAPSGRTRPIPSKLRHLPTLLRPGTGALRQGHCRPRAVCFSVLSARARKVWGFDATAFGVDDLLTRLPRVEPSRGRGATVRPWAGLHNPFRIEAAPGNSRLDFQAQPGLRFTARGATLTAQFSLLFCGAASAGCAVFFLEVPQWEVNNQGPSSVARPPEPCGGRTELRRVDAKTRSRSRATASSGMVWVHLSGGGLRLWSKAKHSRGIQSLLYSPFA